MKEEIYEGDLVAKAGEIYPYTKVTGDISSGGGIKEGAFPVLKSNGGDIYSRGGTIEKGAFPVLKSNGGDIYSRGGIKEGAFPVLKSNGGDIYSSGGTIEKGAFPVLKSNGGYISSGGGTIEKGAFPVLKSNGGYISSGGGTIEKGAFPVLKSNGGYISSGGGTIEKGAFPVLKSNGGDITSSGGTIEKGAFPVLESNGGHIYSDGDIKEGVFPVLKSNGGDIYSGGGTIEKGAFPVLKSNGGYISSGGGTLEKGAFPVNVKKNDPEAPRLTAELRQRCRALLLSSFAATGYSFADGILAKIVSKRGPVSRVIICGKTEVTYLVTNGDAFSHGKTLKEARDNLIYKIGSRDTTEFKSWKLDKKVSKGDAIRAYRCITGACEGGVRSWMEQRQTPEAITIKGIIELTKRAYGADVFEAFFVKESVSLKPRRIWSE